MTDATKPPGDRARRRRWVLIGLSATVLFIGLSLWLGSRTAFVQDRVTRGIAESRILGTASEMLAEDELHVIVCGSGSPLPNPERAQACVIVFAGGRGYVFDIGVGSAGNLGLWRVPTDRVEHLFLTHFHSDHIGDLYELNLQGWTTGRDGPLRVHGPPGVETVVAGFQEAYSLDRRYRVAHHGAELLAPATGELVAAPFQVGDGTRLVHEDGELRISAFRVDHSPIEPAVGYRIEFRGRSVVVSGDTAPAPALVDAYKDADLLLHEALADHVVSTLEQVADEAGRPGLASIFEDIRNYHTTPVQAAKLANDAGVRKLVLYHLVPGPPSFPPLATGIFLRGVSDVRPGVTLAADGSTYTLPSGSDAILERSL